MCNSEDFRDGGISSPHSKYKKFDVPSEKRHDNWDYWFSWEGSSIASIASVGGMDWVNKKDILLPLAKTESFEERQQWVKDNEEVVVKDHGHINQNPPYNFSKEILILWMKYSAYKLSEKKIRINTLSPGSTLTPMSKDFDAISKSDLTAGFVSGIGRPSTPQEQAKVMVFLNSDLASYVSGQDLQADYAFVTTTEFPEN